MRMGDERIHKYNREWDIRRKVRHQKGKREREREDKQK
jgi:hypothetical protein